MKKAPPGTTMAKYIIRAKIEVEGEVEKSDVIGALFGFTEGIFGDELDLRELQDKGRIGRISVELKSERGRSVGEIIIPSNLDRIETALLAALIESVERVGPYNAKVSIIDIVDVRAEKLKKIMERATELARKYFVEKAPDLKEVLNKVSESVRTAELAYYGPERLPAGPDVDEADTVIIVEGRADVLNLLRYGYRNVIALEGAHGAKVPESIIKLATRKTAILFIDGDRAGELIAKEVLKVADIDYVARAPAGREVEELTAKEIAKALKNAIPAKQFLESLERKIVPEAQPPAQPPPIQPQPQPAQIAGEAPQPPAPPETQKPPPPQPKPEALPETLEMPIKVVSEGKKLLGTLEALLYNDKWEPIERVPVRDLVEKLQSIEPGKVYAIVFDGIITQRLLDAASAKGVRLLLGVRIGNVVRKPENVYVLSFQDVFSISS